jgi:hypothetical protein
MKIPNSTILRHLVLAAAFSFAASALIQAEPPGRPGPGAGREGPEINPLPHGYAEVRVGRDRFYTHKGVFYRPTLHGYAVCPAPRGALIRILPPHCVRVYVGDILYYRFGDVYYRTAAGGYIVVDTPQVVPPPTVVIAKDDYQSVWVGENEYLFKNGQFFRRTQDGIVWVPAPVGALTSVLPRDVESIWYQEVEYFDSDGVIFKKTPEGYRVVQAPWKK